MQRYICIHGHFYQPPRENPWLEEIEIQDSAYPYHDWNEKISAECYSQNGASRVLGSQGRIAQIINNYSRISFNFGPTLLSWLERKDPETYQSILAADYESRTYFNGHGSALAQPYNHMILPLANRRDKVTQVLWGIEDFTHRFKRPPEGMWLPETAADLETLEVLAESGIAYTVLSPYQAKRVRKMGDGNWNEVTGARIDPSMAYLCKLPSGKSIVLFFYDGPLSRAVAFEKLLSSGETFARRLASGFSDARTWPQLVSIATDGESYGHHHRFGDMALSFALDFIESQDLASLTNYGAFLEKHPPTHQAEIIDNTAWSCSHGVDRWRSNCGCNSGMRPQWHQRWRGPLRESLDWLRDELNPKFESMGKEYFGDPWKARDEYIEILHNRSPEAINAFLTRHSKVELTRDNRILMLKLLGIQRHLLLMFTSCGWFFDDIAGIETVQVIQYAGRAVQLAQQLFGDDIEGRFLQKLERAEGNQPELPNGRVIYDKNVKPAMLDLPKVAAHYAVSSLFDEFPDEASIYCYIVNRQHHESLTFGRTKLNLGKGRIHSNITLEETDISYAALHLGDHNVAGGVKVGLDEAGFNRAIQEVKDAYQRADLTEIIRLFDRHFGDETFTLRSLFRDERQKFLNLILKDSLEDADTLYLQIYEDNAQVMRFLTDLGIPIPNALQVAAERALNHELENAFEVSEPDLARISQLLQEAKERKITLDGARLSYTIKNLLEKTALELEEKIFDQQHLKHFTATAGLIRTLPFDVNLWRIQNIYYRLVTELLPEMHKKTLDGDLSAKTWVESFLELGDQISIRTNGF